MKSNYCLVDHVRLTSFVGSCSSHVMFMEFFVKISKMCLAFYMFQVKRSLIRAAV
jgi:hypothetical protein